MSHSKRHCVRAAEEELKAVGAIYRLEINKHYKFWITAQGREHLYVCSGTAGENGRAEVNTRSGVRRLLRQLGLLGENVNRG